MGNQCFAYFGRAAGPELVIKFLEVEADVLENLYCVRRPDG